MSGRKVKVIEGGKVLFTGTEGPGSAPWAFWHRVTPDRFIDLPPKYKVEPVGGEPEVSAETVHLEAVREREHRKVRAGVELSDDIRLANKKYLAELAEADRMFGIRIQDHPLPEGYKQ